ncbi:MAG TPA: hypothetical protein VE465_02065 [Streptosporangiaceae bacterium]|jgi:hypothetical protein|nr:hypothetical protein [Streptosporangiaceae bacterium]
MAKVSGLGAAITVDDSGGTARVVSNSETNFEFATPRGVQDTTGVDKSAMERLLLLADFSCTFSGVFDTTASVGAHAVFSSVSSTSVARTTKIQPTSSATPYLQCEALYTDYQVSRADSGALTFQAPGVLSDGAVPTWTNS